MVSSAHRLELSDGFAIHARTGEHAGRVVLRPRPTIRHYHSEVFPELHEELADALHPVRAALELRILAAEELVRMKGSSDSGTPRMREITSSGWRDATSVMRSVMKSHSPSVPRRSTTLMAVEATNPSSRLTARGVR
ncbi:MAG: hypothetical protein ACE5HV_12110 [Acidobacteriota bacterium]